MPRLARAFVLALAMLVSASRGLRAQCDGGGKLQINDFTVTPTALQLPPASATTLGAGASVSSYTIDVTPGNNGRFWYLCVIAQSPSMGTVGGYTKPLSDLQWSLDGSSWTSFAMSLQPIMNARGRQTITLYVRSLLSTNDVPNPDGSAATYAANLRFQVDM